MTPLQYAKALRRLATVPAQIAAPVARRIKKDIERYFSAGEDPYGSAWAPLAKSTIAKGRHPPPLTDTRAGRRGIKVTPGQGAGVRILSSTEYMVYHMRSGPYGRPARKFLPEGELPRRWSAIWKDELEKQIRGTLGN